MKNQELKNYAFIDSQNLNIKKNPLKDKTL